MLNNKRKSDSVVQLNHFQNLCEAERKVYHALLINAAQPDDLKSLAKLCNLTEFQVDAALQLLYCKDLFPELNEEENLA